MKNLSIFTLFATIILVLQSCNNLFLKPQPNDVENESRIPNSFHGVYNTAEENLKFEVGTNYIKKEEKNAFKDEKKVYFIHDDLEYVVKEGEKHRITNVYFRNDSVFGDVTVRKEYLLNKNLILKKIKGFYVFNFREYQESWSPCFLYQESNTYVASILKPEVIDKLAKNDNNDVTENFDFEDVTYFIKRKEQFLLPVLSFNTKTKRIILLL